MKSWGFLVAFFYVLILLVMTVPVGFVCFGNTNSVELYREGGYWLWLMIMFVGELLLLFIPVDTSERKLKSRRHLLVPVLTAALMFGVLVFLMITSLGFAFLGDDLLEADSLSLWLLLLVFIGLWGLWGSVFYRYSLQEKEQTLSKRLTNYLLKGSILELLIAVPSHIVVRQREDCCAPAGTFLGIVMGLSVMLLSFGPGVFYLYIARKNKIKLLSTES